MIHVRQMAQFMDHHIIEDRRRRQHEPPVEGERSFGAAASPPGLLAADGNAAVCAAGELLEVGGSFGKVFFRRGDITFLQCGALRIRQIGRGNVLPPFHHFEISGDDPYPLVNEKVVDLFLGDALRNADGDLPVGIDADRQTFPAAADKGIGKFIEPALILDPYCPAAAVIHSFLPLKRLCT